MKIKIAIASIVVLFLSFAGTTTEAATKFSDVPKTHFAASAIEWAVEQKIVSGYENGKFGLNDYVTEEQFIKMLAETLQLKETQGNIVKLTATSRWSDTYYNRLAIYEAPLTGYTLDTLRSKPITRGQLAQIISAVATSETDLIKSINFLVNSGITSGVDESKRGKDIHAYFGTKQNLTRAQTVVFLKRMVTNKIQVNKPTKEKIAATTLAEKVNAGTKNISEAARLYEPSLMKAFQTYSTTMYLMYGPLEQANGDMAFFINPKNYRNFTALSIYSKTGKVLFHKTGITIPIDPLNAYISGNRVVVQQLYTDYYYDFNFKLIEKKTRKQEFENISEAPNVNELVVNNQTNTFTLRNIKTKATVLTYKLPTNMKTSDLIGWSHGEYANHFTITYTEKNRTASTFKAAVFTKSGKLLNVVELPYPGEVIYMEVIEGNKIVLGYFVEDENYNRITGFSTYALNGVKIGESKLSSKDYHQVEMLYSKLVYALPKKDLHEKNPYIIYKLN